MSNDPALITAVWTNEQFWGLFSAGLLNVLGWLLLHAVRHYEARKEREEKFARNFEILQDRYGFDFSEHGTGIGKVGSAGAHGRMLPCLGDGSCDDCPR